MASKPELTPDLLNSTLQIMKEILTDCINYRRKPLGLPILATFKIRAWLRQIEEHLATLRAYHLSDLLQLQLKNLQDFVKETSLHPILRKIPSSVSYKYYDSLLKCRQLLS